MDYNYPLFVISSTAKVSKNLKKKNIFSSDSTSSESDDEGIAFQTGNDKRRQPVPRNKKLGMISHKKSLITIFGHKHKIKNFILKFDIFHEKKKKKKIQLHLNFSPYLE